MTGDLTSPPIVAGNTGTLDPVLVLGFGRSGTTWISDIISRTTGQLVLFEPFHPSVTDHAADISYGPLDESTARIALELVTGVLTGDNQRPWLLRNHIPFRVEDMQEDFQQLLWRECEVLGFKEIRANFDVAWLGEHVSRRIVFIVRHPYGVVASIRQRSNFWEFGWPGTFELMMSKTILADAFDGTALAELRPQARSARSDAERIALMWTATHLVALPQLRELGLPVHNYADFIAEPFNASRKLLSSIAVEGPVHPSQLFSPSVTAEVPAAVRHGITRLRRRSDRATSGRLTAQERTEIDRIIEPVFDLVDLGPFSEPDGGGA